VHFLVDVFFVEVEGARLRFYLALTFRPTCTRLSEAPTLPRPNPWLVTLAMYCVPQHQTNLCGLGIGFHSGGLSYIRPYLYPDYLTN
jgi:hypothetical protein